MRNRCVTRLCVSVLAVVAGLVPLRVMAEPPAGAAENDVRLGVIIVVDQLRADMLTRYWPHFGNDGFKRLARTGAWFPNAYLTYGATSTASGHATIATGRLPRQHGIVNSDWYLDPEIGDLQSAVLDRDAKPVGLGPNEKADGCSPRYLIGATIGDSLKLADRQSRVFSVSLDPSSAIMLGGQSPDGAFWFDRGTGKFITSTWYRNPLPAYLADFNEKHVADHLMGQAWDRVLPEAAYASCYPVDANWIGYDYGLGKTFPHKLTKAQSQPAQARPYDFICGSPFGNDAVVEAAKRILVNEKLGQGPARDLFCVSLSANEVVGRVFGPNSAESLDMTVRTDRQVAELLSLLDKQVGLNRCAIILTSDHGVQGVPQLTEQARMDGAHLDQDKLVDALNAELADRFGALEGNKKYVAGISPPWLWFDYAFREWELDKQLQVINAATDWLNSVQGIAAVYNAADLEQGPPTADDLLAWLAWRSYCPGRAGQIYIHLDTYWYETEADGVTGHGSSHSENRHVPILLSGPGVKQGRYLQTADLMDIAPTLANMLGIEPPNNAVGRVLDEAF
jgi:hypothetical protein